MKISKKWLRMAELYKRFASDFEFADFSNSAEIEMFNWESRGVPIADKNINGFALGKKWMDVTVAMWLEDISKGLLYPRELMDDNYPEWFLRKVGVL